MSLIDDFVATFKSSNSFDSPPTYVFCVTLLMDKSEEEQWDGK